MENRRHGIAFIHEDDSAGISMVRMSESAGFQAHLYSSVSEFLATADLEEIECVVLDDALSANMGEGLLPLRNGRQPHSFPIILLSKSDEERGRQRARDMGAAAFFREPIDGEALLDAIRWTLCEPSEAEETSDRARNQHTP